MVRSLLQYRGLDLATSYPVVVDFSLASDFSPHYCMDYKEMKNPNQTVEPTRETRVAHG
jgi:hypothetical protein